MVEIKTPLPLRENERVTLAPRSAVLADLKWIRAITIVCPSPTEEGRVSIEYLPMTRNGVLVEKDDAGQTTTRTVGTESLYADKDSVPELATAFAAFLACIEPMERFHAERSGQSENIQND
jgi:hypothetical protein